jgi:hypothetical protein
MIISVLLNVAMISSLTMTGPDKKAEALVQKHIAAVGTAQSLTVEIETIVGSASPVRSSMTLARPDFAKFETPGNIRIVDGKKYSDYFKGEKKFFTREARPNEISELLSDDTFMAWSQFFSKDASKLLKTATYDGTGIIDKKSFECVKVTIDPSVNKTARIYFDPTDGLAKHVEFTVATAAKAVKTLVLSDRVDINLVQDAKVAFAMPAGAVEVPEADLVGVKWFYSLDEGLRVAQASGKKILLDFYADW